MPQELIEQPQLKVMTVDQAQREHYRQQLAKFTREGPKIIAGIKNEEGCNKASAWRLEVRAFIKSVETGRLGDASAELLRLKREVDAEIDKYVEPCEKLFKEAKFKMDRWYLEEAQRVRLANEKLQTKTVEKAEEKRDQKVQLLMDMGKPKAAMVEAKKPLAIVPRTLEVPKIENAAWKKKYIIQIDDLGALLKYIAAHSECHEMINQDSLVSKLEAMARTLNGNMARFSGVTCFVTPDSVTVGGTK